MLVRCQHCYCYSLVSWPEAVGHKNTLSDWACPLCLALCSLFPSSISPALALTHHFTLSRKVQSKTGSHGSVNIGEAAVQKVENEAV